MSAATRPRKTAPPSASRSWPFLALVVAGALLGVTGAVAGSLAPAASHAAGGSTVGSAPAYRIQAPSEGLGADPIPLLADPVPPQVAATVPVGTEPRAAALDPVSGDLYVVNGFSDNVSVVSGTSVVATIPLEPNETGTPDAIVYDAADGYLYVLDQFNFESEGGAVSVISGTVVIAVVPVGTVPIGEVYDNLTGDVYVSNAGSANVSVISGLAVVGTIPAGTYPEAIAFDWSSGDVYVANQGSADVTIISGLTVSATVPVGSEPDAVAYNAAENDVYVANNATGNVSVLDGATVVASPDVGTNPISVEVDPSTGLVYVTNANSSSVSILSFGVVLATVAVGLAPLDTVFDASLAFAIVIDSGADAVSVLNGSSVAGTVAVGGYPTTGIYDAAEAAVYVLDSGSNQLSVLETAYAVTFEETGLVASTEWTVELAASNASSDSSSITFASLPGAYAYAIGTPAGYSLVSSSPASPLTVSDGPVTVDVVFASASAGSFTVTFEESGLPTVCGNSSHGYGSPGPWDPIGPSGFDGRSECGCGGGSSWSPLGPVAFGGGSAGEHCGCGGGRGNATSSATPVWSVTLDGVTESTTNTSLTFTVPNGTYAYTIGAPSGYVVRSSTPASPLTVAGANVTVAVDFGSQPCTTPSLTVTFEESGLARGTTWCVTLATTSCSSSSSIVFTVTNGSFAFSIPTAAGETPQPASGTVTVAGHSVVVSVRFTGSRGSCGSLPDLGSPATGPRP